MRRQPRGNSIWLTTDNAPEMQASGADGSFSFQVWPQTMFLELESLGFKPFRQRLSPAADDEPLTVDPLRLRWHADCLGRTAVSWTLPNYDGAATVETTSNCT